MMSSIGAMSPRMRHGQVAGFILKFLIITSSGFVWCSSLFWVQASKPVTAPANPNLDRFQRASVESGLIVPGMTRSKLLQREVFIANPSLELKPYRQSIAAPPG